VTFTGVTLGNDRRGSTTVVNDKFLKITYIWFKRFTTMDEQRYEKKILICHI